MWQSLPHGMMCHNRGVPDDLRERKKARTRAAISAAALRLFAERGYEAVTIADVAAAAEVGQRTVFRYFGDKDELLFGEDLAFRAALADALAARPRRSPRPWRCGKPPPPSPAPWTRGVRSCSPAWP